VDIGVATPLPAADNLIARRIAFGTRNFCQEPAMTEEELIAAINAGIELAFESVSDGCDLLGFGEMGIGNTTSASAIAAAVTGNSPKAVVGHGAGADEACMARKRSAVERALVLHADHLGSPLGIMRCVGGFEIAAMSGFCLGAAARRVPVVTDGFIATAAAALAVRLAPAVSGYLFASHRSAEPGHAFLLALLDQDPLLDLGMRLGEGTGVALAMNLIQAGIAAFTEMATFAGAGVSNR
jgi:nicotinate-nucleotide--dimethylbenzimidazole phosphoribosyltransferase